MIGTIRKHSKWLWGITVPAMIISLFLFFLPSWRNGGGGASGDFGSVYGKIITQQEYVDAVNEFKLFYLFNYGTWPDKKANMSQKEMDQATYERLLLAQKAS